MNSEAVEMFKLVHGREPKNEQELIEDQRKAFSELGGNY